MAGDQTTITVPEELFEVSEGSSFSGRWDLPELQVGPDTFAFAQPLPWDVLVLSAGDGSLLVTGHVRGVARVGCARCLEEFELDFEGEVEGSIFRSRPEPDGEEGLDEGEFAVLGDDHTVDLAGFLEAALVLDAPLVPLHDEDCLGLCPRCGKNLNEGPCGCGDGRQDDAPSAKNPFAALKDYRFN